MSIFGHLAQIQKNLKNMTLGAPKWENHDIFFYYYKKYTFCAILKFLGSVVREIAI